MDFDYTPQEEAFRKELRTWLETNLRLVHLATEMLGPYSQMAFGAKSGPDGGYWSHQALASRLYTIAGGTSEVMRNIIGDRVLALPKG